MYNKILFPTDGGEESKIVFDSIIDIASRHNSTLHIVNVIDPTENSILRVKKDFLDIVEEEGKEMIKETADSAKEKGIKSVTDILKGKPSNVIIEYAESQDIELIIMPTQGSGGLERFLLGSTTERVVRKSSIPVLTIRPREDITIDYPYKKVLVPTDGSDYAKKALKKGIEISDIEEAELHLMFAICIEKLDINIIHQIQEMWKDRANEILEEASEIADNAGIESIHKTVKYGSSAYEVILSYINNNNIDIVVLGTHGRSGFNKYRLGSVTEHLIRESPIPVLTV